MDKAAAKQSIAELVRRFGENIASYKNGVYNETQTRREFIDPFFEALGWDVDNKQGLAEAYKEVIHEYKIDNVKQDFRQSPDYCFTIYGQEKFFVEAKKPSVNIKQDVAPAYQVRSYAWSAGLPISIVTDFEEFAVYDCVPKPNARDKVETARIEYLTFREYIDKFDFLWDTFSKERVLQGSFDKYVAADKGNRGKETVGREFLKLIEEWRRSLANNIAANNDLSDEELNYAVQQTIDRIIFLIICEDRKIEPANRLKELAETPNIYKNLFRLFSEADEKYNSGLFDFRKDTISARIVIDDKKLKTLLDDLYNSPYQFSRIPVEILGSVYEQFLGKVIRKTKTAAVIDDKPEVKVAGGVFYTPQYVVNYIVRNTVGTVISGKTPAEISRIKIVDPACGSGSFLIGAYKYLLDYHQKYYLDNPKKNSPLTPAGELTTAEKKRILLNNLYGVDIDAQAVEVTKLSLLLQALDGETEASINTQLSLLKERVLPTLDNNIKCGNSLVSNEGTLFTVDNSVKPFDWKINFPAVFAQADRQCGRHAIAGRECPARQGGFDIVIGNPPYVKEYTARTAFEPVKNSHLARYYQGKMDLWYFFVCWGLDILKEKGLLSFIAPSNWITNAGASILRNKVLTETEIQRYFDFNDYKVFENAGIQTMIFCLQKKTPRRQYAFTYNKVTDKKIDETALKNVLMGSEKNPAIEQVKIRVQPEIMKDRLIAFVDASIDEILEKIIKASNYLLTEKNVAQGIVCPQDFVIKKHLEELKNSSIKEKDGVFIISSEELRKLKLSSAERKIIKPYYTTEQLHNYYGDDKNISWVIYSDMNVRKNIKDYPNIKAHLDKYKKIITSDFAPYGLHRAREQAFFEGKKIISLRKTARPCFTYTDFPCYVSQTYFSIKPQDINLKYLTGLLNSSLVNFWLYHKGKKQGEQLQVDKEPLLQIPIVKTDDKQVENTIIKCVDEIIALKKQLQGVSLANQKEQIENRIKFLENRIDEVVFKLYGLVDDDIKIVNK
ncbi:MAG: N-6 DNA methylase [Candidatus Margulisbacteria bacterium]|jgi:adenine-specific DNA-methyltransferase|nr:N-6 DNA methylase [Candidatus Margulisiibacteriota bacterium]